MKRYLSCQFHSDPRVVDVSPWIWKPISSWGYFAVSAFTLKVAKIIPTNPGFCQECGSHSLVYGRAQPKAITAQRFAHMPVELRRVCVAAVPSSTKDWRDWW